MGINFFYEFYWKIKVILYGIRLSDLFWEKCNCINFLKYENSLMDFWLNDTWFVSILLGERCFI